MKRHRLNTIMIASLPIASLAVIAVAIVIALTMKTSYHVLFSDNTESTNEELKSTCISNGASLLIRSEDRDGILHFTASYEKDESPKQAFSNISTLLLSCNGYVLDRFCAGAGCANGDKVIADFRMAE